MNLRLKSLGIAALLTAPASAAPTINAVYFAQTHVQKAADLYPTLVGNRPALIKAHVVDPVTPGATAPAVTATLLLGGNSLVIPLTGPATLPASIADGLGIIQHSAANSFTATIPAAWVRAGLTVTVNAGAAQTQINNLNIGAPNKVIVTMTDVHFFELKPGDYPTGWDTEIEAKWPVSDLDVRRANDVVFPELVIPPRAGAPAARIVSQQDYVTKTGIAFDGENSAATAWNVALRRAAGRSTGYSLHYLNKYNTANEGVAGGFSGVGTGNANSVGLLHHELGHALSLPHWGDSAAYPYKGAMHGINPPAIYNLTHAGPTWAYDLPSNKFIPCTTQSGTYKADPMQGGGTGFQESPFLLNHFSDYSVSQMRGYLENTIVVWNAALNSYAKWNNTTKDYTTLLTNDGVKYPGQRDQQVISVIASVSGVTPAASMVYPPIGPYTSGIIRLFDPTVSADRTAAQTTFAPTGGCDVCLRVTQGGIVKTYMLAASYDPTADPLNAASLVTEGINLPVAGGTVTKVELLLTPDAQVNGLPSNPQVLYKWTPANPPTPSPGTFATAPAADSPYAISMTATLGIGDSDFNGRIEYLFTETTGRLGGTTSGWQSSPSYTDSSLQPNTQYSYTVTIRSGVSKAVTSPSAGAAATTLPGTAVQTFLTSVASGSTNSWNNGTWSAGVPAVTIAAIINPGVAAQISTAPPTWSGTLSVENGASLRINTGGENVIGQITQLTLRNATILDTFGSTQSFRSILLDGGGFFDCLNDAAPRLDDRIFDGIISGNGGFSINGRGLTGYIFTKSNTFTGGLAIRTRARNIVRLNAPGAAGNGDVTTYNDPGTVSNESTVITLGANNVFAAGATLRMEGKGWDNTTDFEYKNQNTILDMQTFNATVARLFIDGVEMPPGSYTGTSNSQDWINGTGTLTVTGPILTPYETWAASSFAYPFSQRDADANPDMDRATNLQEFAFGTDPTLSGEQSISYTSGGNVTNPGQPLALNMAVGGGVDFRAVFGRRKNYIPAGLTYTVEFSADLSTWVPSTTAPTLLTAPGSSGDIEAVSVPFPLLIPVSGGQVKPTFFRVGITAN